MRTAARLACCLLLVFATAALGGYGSVLSKGFYASLVRPDWAPPSWLFGPVWTCLYAMIALSGFMAWQSGRAGLQELVVYLAQLGLNALWPWIFFVWGSGRWAFVEILVLWLVIVATVMRFRHISGVAAALK